MAAVQAPTALTPPSSSHGGQSSWSYSVPTSNKENSVPKPAPANTNGYQLHHSNSRPNLAQRRTDTFNSSKSTESTYLAPVRLNELARKDSTISETGSAPDSLLDLYGPNRSAINSVDYGDRKIGTGDMYADTGDDQEHSRWIHRDKLARIESQELQAAGIILPRARAASRSSRRDHSRDQHAGGTRSEQVQKRQKIEAVPTEEEEVEEIGGWDLRLPEEQADDLGDIYKDLNGKQGVSRIPVCKTSPVPIPIQHLERDTPIKRKQSSGWSGDDDSLAYAKPRTQNARVKTPEEVETPTAAKRVNPENSPSKKTHPGRKSSLPSNRTTSAAKRPPTRTGPNRDSTPTRPPTRSGEAGTKRPEGDPPWLASMYKPDPRLPPDQQLLPTVAKRLQQEQWEKEGKFGNTYDTSFRPMNDEELPQPEATQLTVDVPDKTERDSEWPLRSPKSPTLSTGRPGTAGTGSYSTMPKISTTPQSAGPQPSPKQPAIKVPAPTQEKKKEGCGCCVVM